MEEKSKKSGKVYNFLPPYVPGQPSPYDKVEPNTGRAAMPPFVLQAASALAERPSSDRQCFRGLLGHVTDCKSRYLRRFQV